MWWWCLSLHSCEGVCKFTSESVDMCLSLILRLLWSDAFFIDCTNRFISPIIGIPSMILTFVQDSVGWLVACQRLLAEVLVRLCQALHLRKPSIERHGRVARVLGHVQVCSPSQLLLDHQRLLQQLQGRGWGGVKEKVNIKYINFQYVLTFYTLWTVQLTFTNPSSQQHLIQDIHGHALLSPDFSEQRAVSS